MPFISSSMVNGDVRECSVMGLSVILALDGRCVEFPLPNHAHIYMAVIL